MICNVKTSANILNLFFISLYIEIIIYLFLFHNQLYNFKASAHTKYERKTPSPFVQNIGLILYGMLSIIVTACLPGQLSGGPSKDWFPGLTPDHIIVHGICLGAYSVVPE